MKSAKQYSYGKQCIDWRDVWSVVKTLKSNFLTKGPKVAEFEKAICDYTGAKYCIALANGTAALHLAMLALDVKEGDEVLTSPNTFLASANCALYVGATPKFADIDPETACISVAEIEKNLTAKTKVLIPVHFAGQSCDMEKIKQIADKNNLFVVEDAAHAIGSEYKNSKVGSCKFSDMVIFSFHPVKNLTTGEGGAITTNSEKIYKKLLLLRSHGMSKDTASLTKNDGPWYYEMHDFGFNYRLTDIQAALGVSQFKKINKFAKRRKEIVEFYRQEFLHDRRFSFLQERDYSKSCPHLFPLLIDFVEVKMSKKEIFMKLQEQGLNLQIHYIPVHLQPFYKNLGFKEGDFPNAEKYYEKTISLPLYFGLSNCDLSHIVNTVKKVIS
jgi:UDP-4-amino-4,6-dideoxy-N-acetyl-beta-L-altrosamine transaminase